MNLLGANGQNEWNKLVRPILNKFASDTSETCGADAEPVYQLLQVSQDGKQSQNKEYVAPGKLAQAINDQQAQLKSNITKKLKAYTQIEEHPRPGIPGSKGGRKIA